MNDVAFYCVCDERYFLGAVAMINSLRLHGHAEPVYVLDAGLTEDQRALLEAQTTLVSMPEPTPPHLAKTLAPLAHPAEVMVLIDADMIVTRPLGELIERARGDLLVGFRDRQQRFFAEWGPALDLGPARDGPYVSTGLLALGGRPGAEVVRLLADRQRLVDYERTFWRADDRSYPFLYADQDVFNAILATAIEPDRVVALDARLAATPPFRRLRVLDEQRLACEYPDGVRPFILHQFVRKPWLEPMYHSVYSRLLARLLLGDDVAIRVSEAEVPLRMRGGLRARGQRALVDAKDLGRFYLGDLLPGWIGSRIEARRRARRRA